MTRVKICGITRIEDALAACEAGADALGFNFSAKSPRQTPPDTARAIIDKLPPFVTPAGIFVEQSPEEIEELCSYCGISVAQLHSDRYTPGMAASIRKKVQVMRVFRPGPMFQVAEVRDFAEASGTSSFLFDAYRPDMEGGTGEVIELSTAIRLFEETRGFGYAVLAGGLNPVNAAEAIRRVRPWGVDTASGVELSPGIKDHRKIVAFIHAVREADRTVSCGL